MLDGGEMEMNNITIQRKGVHHGARYISSNSIIKILPGIENIKDDIDQFRRVAFDYNKNMSKEQKEREYHNYFLATEKFNNTISILGQRGTGKTSAMMTLFDQIHKGSYFRNKDSEDNKYDIINRIIDPEEMGDGSDSLGWIITALDKYIGSFSNMYKNNSDLLDTDCLRIGSNRYQVEILKDLITQLRVSYISSKKEYSNLMNANSSTLAEYNDKVTRMLSEDYDFHEKFNNFITSLVDFKRKLNGNEDFTDFNKEPLIYFFFDDVDTSAKHCPNILINILNFLCHPNIVVCISGNYDVFERCMIKYFLKMTNYPQRELTEDEIDNAHGRSEFFLKKVLPATYRYRIIWYTNEVLFGLRYNEEKTNDESIESKLEELNILQLISYVFEYGFTNSEIEGEYLDFFTIPKYGKSREDIVLKNNRYLYAYLSVFGKNVRSFMNVYSYLYTEAISVYTLRAINNSKIEKNKYWNNQRFSEFVNVLLESKFTYSRFRKKIDRFLKFKYDLVKDSKVLNNDDIRNLRIDCEELNNIVIDILSDDSNKDIDKKGIIESLIMLAIFVNEIFYVIHKDEYLERYNSVQERLKQILCNTFINSLNSNLQILPVNLNMGSTLCFYYRLTSRLTLKNLKDLGESSLILTTNDFYLLNVKKYIRQLLYATCLIYSSKSHDDLSVGDVLYDKDEMIITNEIKKQEIKYLYDIYEKSTYSKDNNNNNNYDKMSYERVIFNLLENYFYQYDKEWFNNLQFFLNKQILTVDQVFKHTIDKLEINISIPSIERKIESVYALIKRYSRRNDVDHKNLQIYFKLLNIILKNKNLGNHQYNNENSTSTDIIIKNNDLMELSKYDENVRLIKLLYDEMKNLKSSIESQCDTNKKDDYFQYFQHLNKIFKIFKESYDSYYDFYNGVLWKINSEQISRVFKEYFDVYLMVNYIIEYQKWYTSKNNKFLLNILQLSQEDL